MQYYFEVKNLKKLDHKIMVATFTLVINDVIEIQNCRLIYSDKYDKYSLFMPSNEYTSSKTKKTAYFPLVKLSSSLQNKALNAALEMYEAVR